MLQHCRRTALLRLLVVLSCLVPSLPVTAQEKTTVTTTFAAMVGNIAGRTTVPLERDGTHVYVRTEVNGKPARFILDTGATLNILTPTAAERLEAKVDKVKARVNGGKVAEAQIGTLQTLLVGEATLKATPILVFDLPDVAECDGILGQPFFMAFAVTLDYADQKLILTNPARFTPPTDVLALDMTLEDGVPTIAATVDGMPGRFDVDTGAAGSLILFAPFVEKNKLREKYSPRINTIIGEGVDGLLYGDRTRIPTLTLGEGPQSVTFENFLGDLSRQTSGGFFSKTLAGNIGGDIWRRFTVTFDYSRNRLYLQKNRLFSAPFQNNRAGIAIHYGGGKHTVVAVVPETPGSRAGIRVGDIVLAVNGTAVDKMLPSKVMATLFAPAGTTVEMTVRPKDGGNPRTVQIVLENTL